MTRPCTHLYSSIGCCHDSPLPVGAQDVLKGLRQRVLSMLDFVILNSLRWRDAFGADGLHMTLCGRFIRGAGLVCSTASPEF